MKIFDLPKRTEFGRVIPKNTFDKHTNTKQKKLMSDNIQRISWTHKLATATTNLPSETIEELQVFLIELKRKDDLKSILTIIQKAIPYHIIVVLKYDIEILISTAAKHINPNDKDSAVIDFTVNTSWMPLENHPFQVNLNRSIDWVFVDFCGQLLGRTNHYKNYAEFVEKESEIQTLEIKIKQLEKQMKRERQFNRKVALNVELNHLKKEIQSFINS